jgi:hypothetical protein
MFVRIVVIEIMRNLKTHNCLSVALALIIANYSSHVTQVSDHCARCAWAGVFLLSESDHGAGFAMISAQESYFE